MNVPDSFFTQFAHTGFSSLGELASFFSQTVGGDFPAWFNAKVARQNEWTGLMLSGGPSFASFNSYWSALLAQRPFSLVEMLAYTSAAANETGGSFEPITEHFNGPSGPHPGIAYLFDGFLVHTPQGSFHKASYNAGQNRSAGSLFRDAHFIGAHAQKPLADKLAHTADPVWDGETYPTPAFSTDGQFPHMGYVLEADFFKFRGRGLIQTTWRTGYRPLVSFVQSYAGAQPVVLGFKEKWAGQDPDLVCTVSSTLDWDALFAKTDLVVACAALLHHGEAARYVPLGPDPATVNGVGRGSVAFMGVSLRGDPAYGQLLRSRVARIAAAMLAAAPARSAAPLLASLMAATTAAATGPAPSPIKAVPTGAALPIGAALGQPELIRRIQAALGAIGLLDPPVDGVWGPVSGWALRAFCAAAGVAWNGSLDAAMLDRLERAATASGDAALFPLRPGADFAGRVVSAMLAGGHWVARHPECLNVLYIEGCGPDGTPDDNAPNQFNDARLLIRIDHSGVPVVAGAWQATTEPGRLYTMNPELEHVPGAARIAFGQYKAWQVGLHHGTMEALVETAPIVIYRDLAKDFQREGPPIPGSFAINQHGGYDYPYGDIKNASAGCLVGRSMSGHAEFMRLVKTDVRYLNGNGYMFTTTVLPVHALP